MNGQDRLKSILKEGDYVFLDEEDVGDAVNHPPHYNNGYDNRCRIRRSLLYRKHNEVCHEVW